MKGGGSLEIWQLTPWDEVDVVLRLAMAAIAGGLIGFERERAEKPAGFRTHMLVCMGAALLTVTSVYGFSGIADPARVAAGVAVGVGFLGAGTIIRHEAGVIGLTTAASIWVVAAIGLAFGTGLYLPGALVLTLVLIALRFPGQRG